LHNVTARHTRRTAAIVSGYYYKTANLAPGKSFSTVNAKKGYPSGEVYRSMGLFRQAGLESTRLINSNRFHPADICSKQRLLTGFNTDKDWKAVDKLKRIEVR